MNQETKLPPITEVARALGLEIKEELGKVYTRCVGAKHDHDHEHPRCGLDDERGIYNCLKCASAGGQTAGDTLGLVIQVRQCSPAEAHDWLRETFHLAPWQRPAAASGPLEDLAGRRGWTVAALLAMGAEAHDGEVFFPMRDADGNVTGHRRRRGDGKPYREGQKALTTKGAKNGLLGVWPLPETGAVLLVEGEADGAAALSAGARAVLATPGATPGRKVEESLQRICAGRKVILAPDPDQAGEGWRDRMGRTLRAAGCEVAYIAPLADQDLDKRLKAAPDAKVELARLAALAIPWGPAKGDGADRGGTAGVEVLLVSDEARVCDEVMGVLRTKETNLFQRAGTLVTVQGAKSDKYMRRFGGLSIVGVRSAWMRDRVSRWCKLVVRREGEKKRVFVPDWVGMILTSRTEWPGVAELVGIANYPVLTGAGLRVESGYDEGSGWLIVPDVVPAGLKMTPTEAEISQAKDTLHEVVQDFPFAHVAGESAWLAYVLTILSRTAFDGPSPLFLADASIRGSGKTKLIVLGGLIATGSPPAVTPETAGDADEERKRIFSILMGGDAVALFDNATKLGGAALDALLTSKVYKDRVLGRTEMQVLPNLTTWTATANNPVMQGDTRRRVLPIRLEPNTAEPEARSDFRHANLMGWVIAERERLLGAALTLLAGWHAAGRPDMGLTPWGSYEEWTAVVRNCLVWAGYPDPALCREELLVTADPDAAQLGALLELLADWGYPLTAKGIVGKVEDGTFSGDAGETIKEVAMGRSGMSARTLGKRLEHWRGRVAGARRLEAKPGAGGLMQYRAVQIATPKNEQSIDATIQVIGRDVKNSGFEGDSGSVSAVMGKCAYTQEREQTHYINQTNFEGKEGIDAARALRDRLALRGVVMKLDEVGRLVIMGGLTPEDVMAEKRLHGALTMLLEVERREQCDLPF